MGQSHVTFTPLLLPCNLQKSTTTAFRRQTFIPAKEIAMRTPTMLRNSVLHNGILAAGLVLAFATAPFSQAMAQSATPQQTPPDATPMQTPTPDTAPMQQMQKSSQNRTVPDKAADAWITTKVKSEFGTTKGIRATDISVSTTDGVVTLTGKVASEDEKEHATRVAQLVKGVKSVDSSGLTIGAGAPGEK
jgi:hyperosmotically inducible periplasmic protein